MTLKQIVENTDTLAGKLFNITVQVAILVSVVSFSIETLPDLDTRLRSVLQVIEIITVSFFTVEYCLRVIVAERKLQYVFSFLGLIDLIAILPFYLGRAIDLRALRILRLLRVFRILKLARYTQAIARYRTALLSIKNELVIFFCATAFLIYIGSVAIYYFERDAQPEAFASVFDAMWWAIVTLTTVGYGDVYPVTIGGKICTAILLFIGLGIVAVPSGLFASALTSTAPPAVQSTSSSHEED